MSTKIPVFKPFFDEEERKAALAVIKSANISTGEVVEKFEKEFATYVGGKYAVAVSSCTAALFLCYKLLQVKTVTIPSVTFVSVANMVLLAGGKVEFTDQIFVGSAYKLNPYPIWDSAHELFKDCFHGGLDCYSFYPTKNLGGIEGGAIVTDNLKWVEHLRMMRDHGMKRGRYSWDYQVLYPGYKLAMNNIQAAVCLSKLKKVDNLNNKRKLLVNLYNQKLNLTNKSLHIYPIFVKNRSRFIKFMKKKGIEVSVHYKPIHKQPAYRTTTSLSKSEKWGRREVSLPLYPNLNNREVDYICKSIKEFHDKKMS